MEGDDEFFLNYTKIAGETTKSRYPRGNLIYGMVSRYKHSDKSIIKTIKFIRS